MNNTADQLPRQRGRQCIQDLYRGCLLGGAVGDALGAPVEFMSRTEIVREFGLAGIQEYVPAFSKRGAITDDTQMTLFTAEGLLRCKSSRQPAGLEKLRVSIAKAYIRWLHTQGSTHALREENGPEGLLAHKELISRRAPGTTCMVGLRSMRDPSHFARNESKGCGGVMRVAPIGMYYSSLSRRANAHRSQLLRDAFDLGCQAAAITHGNPTGQLAAGVFASIIMELLGGAGLSQAIEAVMPLLLEKSSHDETVTAIRAACQSAADRPNDPQVLALLGEGWNAEEALAIALYCALSAADFRSGVELAVNHSGDSDSTGSMTGQLLGAGHGQHAIPATWLEPLELRTVIASIADNLALPTWPGALSDVRN